MPSQPFPCFVPYLYFFIPSHPHPLSHPSLLPLHLSHLTPPTSSLPPHPSHVTPPTSPSHLPPPMSPLPPHPPTSPLPPHPPTSPLQCMMGTVPLGTGNDLSRVLGWGRACDDDQKLPTILHEMELSGVRMLDRWSVQCSPLIDENQASLSQCAPLPWALHQGPLEPVHTYECKDSDHSRMESMCFK